MKYKMYVDESGNTGEPRLRNGQWNYGNQPYFGLGSLMVKEEDDIEISNSILQTLQKYDPSLGTENELKSKNNYCFKSALLEDLFSLIEQYGCISYFDISNKKYKVICYIVEYCVYPYYVAENLIGVNGYRSKRIDAAKLLYYYLDDSLIERYDIMIRDKSEELNKEKLIEFLEDLKDSLAEYQEICNGIIDTMNHIKNNPLLRIKNLIPVEDYNNKGNSTFFLPNIDALNNIVAQQAVTRIGECDSISIIHDEQTQFSNSLIKWIEYQQSLGIEIYMDAFVDSKKYPLMQSVDFILGTIMRLFQKIIDRKSLTRNEKDIVKMLKPMVASANSSCNIVSVQNEQIAFFDVFGLKTERTNVPYLFL